MRKKFISLLSAAALLSMCACSEGNSASPQNDATEATAQTEAATEAPTSEFPAVELSGSWENDPNFETYVSNTVIATGSNKFIPEAKNMTYRAWIPVEEYGTFDYAFYFSNTVDSTWERGTRQGYVGMPGGAYEITGAFVGDGGSGIEDEPTNMTPVTFNGSGSKSVQPGETFWSDPVNFTVEEGHYLLWEWTISGEDIPCICMSGMTHAYADKGNGQGFYYVNEIPLPVLFGCNRDTTNTVITLGDSITQGCETTENACESWAAELSKALGDDTSLWNLGLGYSRATDAAQGGDWLKRARYADTVVLGFGTNDIITGKYGEGTSTSAVRIKDALQSITTVLTDAGCNVIILSAPPFDMIPEMEAIRQELNTYIPEIAESNDKVFYFDFASLLESPDDPSKAIYGGHPNDEGCDIIAEALMSEYGDILSGNK